MNTFEQVEFQLFCTVLNGELKELNSTGKYIHKKTANVINERIEETLWEKGLLHVRNHSLQALSDNMVFLIGLFTVLQNGESIGDYHT